MTLSGLVAAYSFDEGTGSTVADASGNGNTGTTVNTAWSSAGKYGNALVFNGSSALVTINNSAALTLTTGMTLEAWVNLDGIRDGQPMYVIGKGRTTSPRFGAGHCRHSSKASTMEADTRS